MTSRIFKRTGPRQCLNYCLDDKLVVGQDEQKHPLYKDRAEILYYNQCFGEKEDLIRQFDEVVALNQNVKEPIFHIALSLPGNERFSKSRWTEVSRECASTLGFAQNQFVTILHKDTACQHVHIVANRIGFDRHFVDAWFIKSRLRNFCNDMEIHYALTQTLDLRQRYSNEERQSLRKNKHLDRLKEALQQTLKTTCDYPAFEAKMKEQEIKVYKNEKGIAFVLDRRVIFRGFEAGFPWKKIEATLQQNMELQQKQELELKQVQEIKQAQKLKQAQQRKQQSKLKQDEQEQPRLRYHISQHL